MSMLRASPFVAAAVAGAFLILPAAGSLILLSGCGETRSEAAADSLKETTDKVKSAQKEVTQTVAHLEVLAKGGDLKKAYGDLNSDISDLTSMAESVKARYASMAAKSDVYVAQWQKEIAQVQDESLRATAEARQAKVKARFSEVKQHLGDVRDEYGPFIAKLKDLQLVLKNDLTPAAIAAAQPTITSAISGGKSLNGKLGTIVQDLSQFAGTLTPTGK